MGGIHGWVTSNDDACINDGIDHGRRSAARQDLYTKLYTKFVHVFTDWLKRALGLESRDENSISEHV